MASSCPSLSLSSPQTLTALIFFISFASHLSLLTAATTIATGSSKTSKTIGSRFTKIYAFGDSFTDTGNTRSASTGPTSFDHVSQLPYGITFFHHPTNRYSDGRLVIDFLAEALSLPYLPPYINRKADTSHGVNFAVAGSTAIDHDFFVRNNLTLNRTPQSLHTQLTWFNELLEGHGCGGSTLSAQCRAELGEALFWVGEIGANDYAYLFGSTVSQTLVQDLAINSVTRFLQVCRWCCR
uniref:Uncharacterized protein n=1 Tax=Nelumbo nucifera TaxID=4432 RepID=A0A822YYM1_NELNU|nr:TPA_asm: hypothetical protein HUJ06_004998 [Nelumbo nucifera]